MFSGLIHHPPLSPPIEGGEKALIKPRLQFIQLSNAFFIRAVHDYSSIEDAFHRSNRRQSLASTGHRASMLSLYLLSTTLRLIFRDGVISPVACVHSASRSVNLRICSTRA